MRIQVNRVAAPVTVLGPGRRIGLWVQGCVLACPGCASVDTWDPAAGRTHDVDELSATIVAEILRRGLDGLTLTGGEPLDQAPALAELVGNVRGRLTALREGPELDVLMFTGYPLTVARKRAGGLWELLDAAVCGRYRQDLPGNQTLLASSNQELAVISSGGALRYPPTEEANRMQILMSEGELVMIGLPRPGDLDVMAERLRERGVELGGISWRSWDH